MPNQDLLGGSLVENGRQRNAGKDKAVAGESKPLGVGLQSSNGNQILLTGKEKTAALRSGQGYGVWDKDFTST
jgi:hypothetical protein